MNKGLVLLLKPRGFFLVQEERLFQMKSDTMDDPALKLLKMPFKLSGNHVMAILLLIITDVQALHCQKYNEYSRVCEEEESEEESEA